jgi:hypothetical protein
MCIKTFQQLKNKYVEKLQLTVRMEELSSACYVTAKLFLCLTN